MSKSKRILAPVLLVLVLGAVIIQLPGMAADRNDALKWFVPIQDIRRMIRNNYVEDITDKDMSKMQLSAINGMIDYLDDPYTVYIPPVKEKEFEKTMAGTYVGIGAQVRMVNGWLTIITPMAGSPALQAGVRAGDEVREIDDDGPDGPKDFTTTKDDPIDDTINRLLGEPGTKVSVKVHSKNTPDDQLKELVITRHRIKVATVQGVHRVGEKWSFYADPKAKVAYIRITQFTGTTFDELRSAMWGLVDSGLKGLVLDLRFNPGGRMDAAIRIADLFIPKGRIVSMKGRTISEQSWDAHERGTLPDFPMIVIVNGQSASASEIVTGALKDNNRAVVLGTRSFGKGKVQDVKQLPSGLGQLKITTAYYYLPSGRNLQKRPDSKDWGVDPTKGFYWPLTNTEYVALRSVQQELDVIEDKKDDGNWADPNWIESRLKDPQLASAMRALHARLDTGKWTPTGYEMPENAEIFAKLRVQERNKDFLEKQLKNVDKEVDRLMSFIPGKDKEKDTTTASTEPILPFDHPLKGGKVEVRDADGNLVRTFAIEDRDDLAVAFADAGLKPIEEKAGDESPVTANTDESENKDQKEGGN